MGAKLRPRCSISRWELKTCATGFVQAENSPRKLAGVGQHKQRTDKACPFLLGQTQSQQSAAGLRKEQKEKRGEASLLKWFGAVPITPAPLHGWYREGHGAVPCLSPCHQQQMPLSQMWIPSAWPTQAQLLLCGPEVPSCSWGAQERLSAHWVVPGTPASGFS